MKILTLCGSLRAKSSNQAVLAAFGRVMPPSVHVEHFKALAEIPSFNPDFDQGTVALPVERFRSLIRNADAVVMSTPEYAHALPGAFKNALDWLVSDPAFVGKAVAILHIARGSTWARDSLREVLSTMSARVVETACLELALGTNVIDEETILRRRDLAQMLADGAHALISDHASSARQN